MIREATEADSARLVEMGLHFVASTPYRDLIVIDSEKLTGTILGLLANPAAVILVSGNNPLTGMLGLMVFDHPFSGERTASEVVWWVEPDARGDGLRLLKAGEDWAKAAGASKINMVAPNDRIESLYARLGYRQVETTYQRSL